MGDLQTRPFSKDYSGLINQSVIGLSITIICMTGQELMKRKRRGNGKKDSTELGSRESWELGYLYNGRSWARHPTPPVTTGWPLSWVWSVVKLPETEMNKLRGVDATLYVRFLRGCFWFSLLHTFTTFPILFPIHVKFSNKDISPKSMTRASISSLVDTDTGRSLLWIHICILFWITISWVLTLGWICTGAFLMRQKSIQAAAARVEVGNTYADYYPHPHPQYAFAEIPLPERIEIREGLRLRTVMVSSVPPSLRDEKELKEYFEYYMSRKLEKPSVGLTSTTQPGLLNKTLAFMFNRAKKLPAHIPLNVLPMHTSQDNIPPTPENRTEESLEGVPVPLIERVVIARKMTELASLLERREDILCQLETAHIRLANRTLAAVKAHMNGQRTGARALRMSFMRGADADHPEENERMQVLVSTLGPFVDDFSSEVSPEADSKHALLRPSKEARRKVRTYNGDGRTTHDGQEQLTSHRPPRSFSPTEETDRTIWEALLDLPRHYLDPYQPLINLSHLFRDKTVPSIDYYTTKINYLTSVITENRAKSQTDFEPVSTAFVTFANPNDARRACKYLAVHPENPLSCFVTMAPMYNDLDWIRVMKSSFHVEFVKDWVVTVGVWAFTLFWLFPVSFFVGLVSIGNIALFWPSLKRYLDKHEWESEIIQSFIPTLLVALLALLIPLILLLIAKKADTITTLSALHDRIMTRYYKFLIVNVLIFFCVGVAALQSFLLSIRTPGITSPDILQVVSDSFPTAGPFYVGWLILTTAMHNGFEIALIGLPLIIYPSTKRQVAPRKRAVGVRPRTFNYYYWLPNHLLVVHVLLLFATLNPMVLPFGALYFFVSSGVIKNQLLHVYAKHYEGNGQLLLIRIVRYSLDGLILAQAIFLAYMVVLKKTANVGLAAFLIIITAFVKVFITRMCRTRFEHDDILEAEILCGLKPLSPDAANFPEEDGVPDNVEPITERRSNRSMLTWRLPAWVNFSYATIQHRPRNPHRRQPMPFGPQNNSPPGEGVPATQTHSDGDAVPHPRISGEPGGMYTELDMITPNERPDQVTLGGAVITHPLPRTWDDQNLIDLPYDNPFYTRSISTVLWLPRNPSGMLDLDQTVDLRTSLTVDPNAGQLGNWVGFTGSPAQADLPFPPSDELPSTIPGVNPFVDGTEEIALPKAIARRVQSKDEVIESTIRSRRPSAYRRRRLTGDTTTTGTILSRQRSGFLESPRLISFSDTSRRGRARTISIISTLRPPASQRERSRSTDYEFDLRPETEDQVRPELTLINASTSRVSIAPPHGSRISRVTTQQAIVHEVLAEEEHALATRLEEEEAEASKLKTIKPWYTSWMFGKKWD